MIEAKSGFHFVSPVVIPYGETSNSLFEVLEDWEAVLKAEEFSLCDFENDLEFDEFEPPVRPRKLGGPRL